MEQYEAEEELRTQLHYAELWKYVNSLLKVELQELYFDALVQLKKQGIGTDRKSGIRFKHWKLLSGIGYFYPIYRETR